MGPYYLINGGFPELGVLQALLFNLITRKLMNHTPSLNSYPLPSKTSLHLSAVQLFPPGIPHHPEAFSEASCFGRAAHFPSSIAKFHCVGSFYKHEVPIVFQVVGLATSKASLSTVWQKAHLQGSNGWIRQVRN